MLLTALAFWTRVMGGSGDDWLNWLGSGPDSSFLGVGYTCDVDGTSKLLAIKLGNNGDVRWAWAFGGDVSQGAQDAAVAPDGSLFILGYTSSYGFGSSDFFLLRLSPDGALEKALVLGEYGSDDGFGISPTSDGGLVLSGTTGSFGEGFFDFLIVKLDDTLGVEWARALGTYKQEWVPYVIQTEDGGYFLAGQEFWFGTPSDIVVAKLDPAGSLEWAKVLGGPGYDKVSKVLALDDGYLIVGGTSSGGSGDYDGLILKLSLDGSSVLWAYAVGSPSYDFFHDALVSSDGIYICGQSYAEDTAGDALVLKLGFDGQIYWAVLYGGLGEDRAQELDLAPTGELVFGGYTTGFSSQGQDLFVFGLGADGSYEECGTEVSLTVTPLSLSLQSFTGSLTDADVRVAEISPGAEALSWDARPECEPLWSGVGEAERGSLRFEAPSPTPVRIFDATGRLVWSSTVQGTRIVPLEPGVYYWKAGRKSGKALVLPR